MIRVKNWFVQPFVLAPLIATGILAALPSRGTAQQVTQQDDNNISVPWVASPPRLDCGDDASQSAAVLLSKETAKLVLLDPEVLRDIPAHFQPSHIAPIIPKELGSSLDYRAKYDFSWDEKNLYVKVDVNDPD